jgi:hypothetical protein
LAEMGWNAEWKYNREKMVGRGDRHRIQVHLGTQN